MKALFVSNDPKLFDEKSTAHKRMHEYVHAIGELHIISMAKFGAQELHEEGLHLYPIWTLPVLKIRALTKLAHKLILERGIEVVSAQDPFEHGLAALRAVEGTNAKLHVQVHTDFLAPWFKQESWKNRVRIKMADRVLPKAAGIRVVSERIKEALEDRYKFNIRVPVVLPIIPTAESGKTDYPAPYPFTLMTVSRLESEKHIEDILTALALIAPRYPGVGLVVVGEGSKREELESFARQLGLATRVQFLGARDDARALMGLASAYIQASSYEGYGISLVEAALAHKPIITSDVGIVGDVLKDTHSALVCPPRDPACLAQKIALLIEDNQLRTLLGQRAALAARAHVDKVGNLATHVADGLRAALAAK